MPFRHIISTRSIRNFATLCLAGLFLLAATGCNTLDRRIQQNADFIATLDPEDQELIRAGKVGLGFTPEMVQIAWGKPDRRQTSITEKGQTGAWIYVTRGSRYDGRRFVGYERDTIYDRRSNTYRTYTRPVYVTTYRTIESESARVEFKDGVVTAITTTER